MPKRSADYESYKSRQAEISRDRSAAGREIGPLPPVADPDRRNACLDDFELFCTTYFANRFPLAFSDSHRVAIDRMSRCIDGGGRFACAMPRGTGKTTIALAGVLRAVLYGLRRFVVLIAATERHAGKLLKQLQTELESNDLLLADFPEACYPVRMLEGIHNRAKGQTLDGERTRIEWTAEGITLPAIKGAACSGAVIQVAGLTGAIRGLQASGPDGSVIRPDLVVIDDAQTRESARSPTQTADRFAIITDDILGLAGPRTTIAAVQLCTVIYPNDLSDRFLSPDKAPEWQGVRTKLLNQFPSNMDLWDQYAEIRRESFRSGDEGRRASEFYLANRQAMDLGAIPTWPERYKDGEYSAVQSAMNWFLDNPRGFRAEAQNEPELNDGPAGAKSLTAASVESRFSGVPGGEAPAETTRITSFIDLGGLLHWYCVVGWNERFGGVVLDYGTWPKQGRSSFSASDARPTLADAYPGVSESQRVYAGLKDLTASLFGKRWRRGVSDLPIDLCLIDSGWHTDAVSQFCRASSHGSQILASKGVGRSTTSVGVARWKPRPGERSGLHWRLTSGQSGRGRVVQFDPDYWKSFLWDRLSSLLGDAGCLTLWGKPGRGAPDHGLFGEHCAAEYAMPVEIRGDKFDKWVVHPDRTDNHWWDTLVGCAVAASVMGLAPVVTGENATPAATPKRRSFRDEYLKRKGVSA